MKHMGKTIFFILCGLVLLVLLVYGAVRLYAGNHATPGPEPSVSRPDGVNDRAAKLQSVSYRVGGGMNGGYYEVRLSRSGKKALLTVEERTDNQAKTKKSTRKADASAFAALEAVIEKYDLCSWSKLPPDETEVLDAPTTTLSFWYEGAEFHNVNDRQALPEDAGAAFAEYLDTLLKLQ